MAKNGKKQSTKQNGKKPAEKAAASKSNGAGSEAAFKRLLPLARSIPRAEVVGLTADERLAAHNAEAGAKALLARGALVMKQLPATKLDDIRQIPDIGLALLYAERRIDHGRAPSGARAKLGRLHELRSLLLSAADTLAKAGLLPARKVRAIRHGRGGYDAAGDCVALAGLFRENAAAIKGKHPVTKTEIDEAAKLGSELAALIRPGRARARARAAATKEAIDDRNRLWTLLLKRYDELWRAGAYVFGQDVDKSIPPLLSHAGRRQSANKKTAKKAAPARAVSARA